MQGNMKKRNRTCRPQLFLTYFHTGLLSLLKVATILSETNFTRVCNWDKCIVNKVKETCFHISQFTLCRSTLFYGEINLCIWVCKSRLSRVWLTLEQQFHFKAGICKGNSAKTFSHLFVAIFSHGPSTD